jgi:asparaginyl-tRNA synthetase
MKRTKIIKILNDEKAVDEIIVKGWVRTKRNAKNFSFVEINDGSTIKNLQAIADESLSNYEDVKKLTTGSSVSIKGSIVESKGGKQKVELQVKELEILDLAPDDYPLQKKRHTDEYLRTIAHLRPRTNKYGAAFRVRSELSFAIHKYFNDNGFRYVHTPIITSSDCEGAGEMFQVTTMDMENPAKENGKIDYKEDFFGKKSSLTVSGQLAVEMFSLALGDVYTFGPTFRAENSNTPRHAAEFWMIEPEMAFCDIHGDMDVAEDFIKSITKHVMEKCADDLALFANFVDKTLMDTLNTIINSEFVRLPYAEAIEIMQKSGKKFEFKPEFGCDLQTEHERFLTEEHFKKPVIVYNYPKSIKPFYMKCNDDGITVAAMDVLVPRIGELIGGSQREHRLDVLTSRIEEMGMKPEDYWWYVESRKFGSVEHAGFGLGFDRMMMLLTGISNIRDVIPFPRTPKSVEF